MQVYKPRNNQIFAIIAYRNASILFRNNIIDATYHTITGNQITVLINGKALCLGSKNNMAF
ncbi:hypothetical protein SDC9_209343 [bioreactor metagenome]|uniref:Uncharacterized protein n=1 Tax=bioreactor metagenome TaxID=1076179 RepID=A0A645JD09_9ZZZZ